MVDFLAANYALLKQLWVLWFTLLFFEAQGRIPLDDDRDDAARS